MARGKAESRSKVDPLKRPRVAGAKITHPFVIPSCSQASAASRERPRNLQFAVQQAHQHLEQLRIQRRDELNPRHKFPGQVFVIGQEKIGPRRSRAGKVNGIGGGNSVFRPNIGI